MGDCRRPAILPRRTTHLVLAANTSRRVFCALAVLCVLSGGLSRAAAVVSDEKAAGERELLQEANRLLEEEVKLASRPQIYLLLDLSEQVLSIKGRGIELHRLPVLAWRVSGGKSLSGLFRLRTRPAVDRPKAGPGKDPSLEPINLQDMPAEY